MDDGKRQYQITDGTFGLSLYRKDTAVDALLDFLADRARGKYRQEITTDGDTASVEIDGQTYTARPLGIKS